jgi:hypothetical protein
VCLREVGFRYFYKLKFCLTKMATADELDLIVGDKVRRGQLICEMDEATGALIFRGCELMRGPQVKVIARNERGDTHVRYLECWASPGDYYWKGDEEWIHAEYSGFWI